MTPILLLLMGCGPETTTIVEIEIDACCCCDDDDCCEDDCDTGETIHIEGDSPCEDFGAPDASEEVNTIEDCEAEPNPIEFAPEVEWTWAPTDPDHPYNQVMMTPVVGNMNDDSGDGVIDTDDDTDVVFTAYTGVADTPGALVILSGDGSEMYYHTSLTDKDNNTYAPMGRGGVALGDIDNDGIPEACFPTSTAPLICIHADGNVVMVGETPSSNIDSYEWTNGFPVIGNMGGGDEAEIAIGRVIWDHTGSIVGEGAYSHGGYVIDYPISPWRVSASVMSDVDDDNELELVAGNVVYERDGSELWRQTTTENGFSAVADLDGDDNPDIVTIGWGTAYILEGSSGTELASFSVPTGESSIHTSGPPTIADFDADGEPEIGVAGRDEYVVYERDGSGNWGPMWSTPIYDQSGSTGASVFDFEADGEAEVIYAGTDELFIWSGDNGADRLGLAGWDPTDHSSGTGSEFPSLADVDGDNSTEIILASNESTGSGWFGVRAIGSGSGEAWAPSRPVWNQHSYHITNINDDLSVPTVEAENWDTFNNFRTQDQGERPGSWLPDLFLSDVDYCADCDGEEATLYVVVDNQGMDASEDVELVFYDSVSGEIERDTVSGLQPQESLVLGPYIIDTNDWTGALGVYLDDGDTELECDETNNMIDVGDIVCD